MQRRESASIPVTSVVALALACGGACSTSSKTNGGQSGSAGAAGSHSGGAAGSQGLGGAGGLAGASSKTTGGVDNSVGSGGTSGSAGESSTGGANRGGSTSAGSAGLAGEAGSAGAGGVDVVPAGASVLMHHASPERTGAYVDATLTHAAAATLHRDSAFNASIQGAVFAQPLFVDGQGGTDELFVVTESNDAYALDPATGATLWHRNVGTPVSINSLPCGNINSLGVTGSPVIDLASRNIFFDAMTTAGSSAKHLIFALSIDDGSVRSGWPVDVSASVSVGGMPFDSSVQNQRAALLVWNRTLYVPYGGHYGDCGNYHGVIVGVPLDKPSAPLVWATAGIGGGVWGPSGVASDGSALFATTGNTVPITTWSGGEAIVRLSAGLAFSGSTLDYFAPSNWRDLDAQDNDIGGTGPVLFDLPGSTPSRLALTLGKNGVAYLHDRTNLGGIGTGNGTQGESLFSANVSTAEIITAAALYTTQNGTYASFKAPGRNCPGGNAGDVTTLHMVPGSPPTFSVAWCASVGNGSPMATTTDGQSNAIVWDLGADTNNKLIGLDGDTGAVIFNGGAAGDAVPGVRRYMTPIVAKGRIYVAVDNNVFAFTTN